MALLLYTYAISSIRAAKRNAALHRAADGGQLDMRRESLRRHGALERVEGTRGLELFRGVSGGGDGGGGGEIGKGGGEVEGGGEVRRALRDAATAGEGTGQRIGRADGGGGGGEGPRRLGEVPIVAAGGEGGETKKEKGKTRRDRTETEGGLEGWKGREGAERLRSRPPPPAPGSRVLEESAGRS
jgi:hypothetical protein